MTTFPFGGFDDAWALTSCTLPDGNAYTVRKITGEQLDTAREKAAAKKQANAMAMLREIGADGMRELQAVGTPTTPTEPDPLDEYDAGLLVRFGVASWGFENPQTHEPVPCDAEWKSRLDGDARDAMAREVLAVNVRTAGEAPGSDNS